MNILFPVLAIELADSLRYDRALIEAIDVNANAIGMRTWHVERLDTTMAAEEVFGHAGIERIGLNIVLAIDEFEITAGHNQMQVIRSCGKCCSCSP